MREHLYNSVDNINKDLNEIHQKQLPKSPKNIELSSRSNINIRYESNASLKIMNIEKGDIKTNQSLA